MGNQVTGRDELNNPKNFKEFWLFYVGEHLNPLSRFLHTLGTTLALIILVAVFLSKVWWGLLLVPVVGYGFAWISHFLVEKNKPATFRYPLWSLMGDFVMLYKTFNNTMEDEVARVKKQKNLFTILLLIFSMQLAHAEEEAVANFDQMRKDAKERYEDFYERKRKREAWDVEKERGVASVKKERIEENDKMEKSRLIQVEERKKYIDAISPLEPAHLRQQKEDRTKELAVERDFSKKMDKIREYQKKTYPIPENEEYEIE